MRGNEVASPILCSANRPLNRESCEDPQCGKWIYGDWGQVNILFPTAQSIIYSNSCTIYLF